MGNFVQPAKTKDRLQTAGMWNVSRALMWRGAGTGPTRHKPYIRIDLHTGTVLSLILQFWWLVSGCE